MNLRDRARSQPCMVRVPGVCNSNPETTVLAHVRLAGASGIGFKSPDLLGAWACSACHDAIDRRSEFTMDRDFLRLCHLEGMARTIVELDKKGWWPTWKYR